MHAWNERSRSNQIHRHYSTALDLALTDNRNPPFGLLFELVPLGPHIVSGDIREILDIRDAARIEVNVGCPRQNKKTTTSLDEQQGHIDKLDALLAVARSPGKSVCLRDRSSVRPSLRQSLSHGALYTSSLLCI